MAELSEDTKAIIQRLKDEGNLIRNSGTNSIKSVNIHLNKFSGVFDVISSNMIEQTRILQNQAGLAQEALEVQRSKEQFDELKTEDEETETRDKDDDSAKKTDENIEKIGDSISSALSLRSLALAGAGLFVGYNLLKGFIDERTGGGFTRMEEGIRDFDFSSFGTLPETFNRLQETMESLSTTIATLPETLGNLNTTLQNLSTSLSSLTESLNGLGPLADRILESIREIAEAWWWKAILVAGAGLAAALINARARVGRMPPIPGLGTGPGGAGRGGFLGRLGATLGRIGIGRLGMAGLGAYSIFQMDAENRAAIEEGGMPALQDLQEQRQNNIVDFFESTPVLSQLMAGYNSLYEMVHGEPPARTTFEAERRENIRTPAEAHREYAESRLEGERLAREAAEQARIDALSDTEYNDEAIQGEIQYLQDEITRLNQMMGGQGIEHPQVGALRAQISELEGQISGTPTPESPTYSGRGVVFERPGEREGYLLGVRLDAMIEATRLLNERNARFDAEMDELERYLQSIESGAGAAGSPIIISAPTNVSPVVNNVSGGRSVNQISVRSGAGTGFGSADPFGLPAVAN